MTLEEKISKIGSLNEELLRQNLLIPLFTKMGFIDPILHHHSGEKGKDIVMKEFDSKFKKTRYYAVVVKAGDVTGSASGSSSYFALLNQIRQAVNEPYKHIYEIREVKIDKIIVVVSGRFLPTALDSIHGTLASEKLDRSVFETIDINKLPSLVDEHFAEYWKQYEDEVASLIKQRNHLLNNLSKLVNTILTLAEQEKFLRIASTAEVRLDAAEYQTTAKYVASIGYNKISIDQIDDFFTDKFITNGYADIKEYFFEIKRKTQEVLYNIDEVIDILKKILTSTDPEKIVDLSWELNYFIGYGGKLSFSTRDIEGQEEFGYGLKEYRVKKQWLIDKGLLQFYTSLQVETSVQTIKHLISFYQEVAPSETNKWLGLRLALDIENKTYSLDYNRFEKEPEVVEKRSIIEVEKLDGQTIDISYAINKFGAWKEDANPEKKAAHFAWHFERGLEHHFFKMTGFTGKDL